MPLIECAQASCRYGPRPALESVSLAFEPEEWAWLLGPSGSGKTTLLRAIAGLESLASGHIHLAGRVASNDRVAIAPHERAIGFLFQEPGLWPHLSCAANVAMGVAAPKRADRLRAAQSWLDRLGVGALAAKFPGEVSGGEARRVALARALAPRPRILLLDEPTAHLDLHVREELMNLLRDLHREERLTTLCVMHQIEPPMAPADRAIILESGRVAHDGALGASGSAPATPYILALKKWLARAERWEA